MQQVVKSPYSLAVIFLFIVHVTFFDQVVMYINKYCYDDWVVENFGKERDGAQKERRHFEQAPEKLDRHVYPGHLHCAGGIGVD